MVGRHAWTAHVFFIEVVHGGAELTIHFGATAVDA